MLWIEDQVPRVEKETKPSLRGKWECFQWKAHGQCSEGDSCSFSHDTLASGNKGEGRRRKGRSSSPASHSKAKQTDGEEQKSHMDHAINRKTQKTRVKFHARFKFCRNLSCKLSTKLRRDGPRGQCVMTETTRVSLGALSMCFSTENTSTFLSTFRSG